VKIGIGENKKSGGSCSRPGGLKGLAMKTEAQRLDVFMIYFGCRTSKVLSVIYVP
jgi:hypothetical protein